MTRPFRSLQTSSDSSTPPSLQQQPAVIVDSDVVVILASLLCALICVLGLIVAARCAWLRRLSFRAVPPPVSASPQNSVANKGLKKKILKSLPRETYTDNLSAKFTDCAICLTEFTSGDEIRALPQCGHSFHVSCIDTWLGSHSSCPSCRQILVVARCQKCGGLPPHAVPSTATVSPSPAGAEPDTSPKEREADDANRFLP